MAWIVSALNLANTIIGVSVLSMPFLLQNCGVVLGFILICFSCYLTIQSCLMLLKAAHITERPTYELLAQYLFGHPGKLLMEISNIGVLFGASIGMFVIIGDIAPTTLISFCSLDWDRSVLRYYTLIVMGIVVVLPMSLLRDIRKLSVAAGLSMIVYFTLVGYLVFLSLPDLLSFQWVHKITYVDFTGILRCLPILALAFCCQTTLFLVRHSHSDKSTMGSVAKAAVTFCAVLYSCVGVFGYIIYYERDIPGDILIAFSETTVAFVLKLLFALTVVASIPLCVFSSRNSLDSLITTYFVTPSKPVINGPARIPTKRFFSITAVLVGGALLIALYIPNVELVLQLTGATMGSLIVFVFPGAYYLKATDKKDSKRQLAMFMLGLGLFLMVVSTCVVVTQSRVEDPLQEVPTTHATEVTTAETEKPTSESEPTPIVKKTSKYSDKPSITESSSDDKGHSDTKEETVTNVTKDIAKSEHDATEREKKGLVKEGSRHEPPVPLDEKEDSDEEEETAKPPKAESHSEETGESKSEDDVQVPGKKVVVDEQEQKKLLDRLNVLEQKVSKLSDDKKKVKEHNPIVPAENGTHGMHGPETGAKHSNESSEQVARQQVDEQRQVQQRGGKDVSVSPQSLQDGRGDAAKAEDVTEKAESDTHSDKDREDEPRDKGNERNVEEGDSHEGKDLKREAPHEAEVTREAESDTHTAKDLKAEPIDKENEQDVKVDDSHDAKDVKRAAPYKEEETNVETETQGGKERTKRDTFNPDTIPSEGLAPSAEAGIKGRKGEDEMVKDTNTNTDGTTSNADL